MISIIADARDGEFEGEIKAENIDIRAHLVSVK